MGKGTILFVTFFTVALLYARYKEFPRGQGLRRQKPTKPSIQTQQSQTKPERLKVIRMKVTGYCPCKICCGKFADGLTSIGKNAWKTDGVATDPKKIPYNTELVIPGIGIRTVDDTGKDMKKSAKMGIYHIDLRFRLPEGVKKCPEEMKKCHERAKQFGKKWLDIAVLGPAN